MPAAAHKTPTRTVAKEVGGTLGRPDREGKRIIAGHFEPDTSFAVHELAAKISRQRGKRVSVQDIIGIGLGLAFRHYGEEPPEELKTQLPPSRPMPVRAHRPPSKSEPVAG